MRGLSRPGPGQLVLICALALAIAGAFVFGYRAGRHAHHFRRQTEPVRAWMSVPFIAHAHHVKPEILFEAAGIPPRPHDRRSLRRIAREVNRPVDDLIRAVEGALDRAPRAEPPARQGP